MKVSVYFALLAAVLTAQTIAAVTIEPDSAYFSPNFDGFHDTAKMKLKLKKPDKKLKLTSWKFIIKNKGNIPVRTFSADTRKMRKGLALFYLFSADNRFAKPVIKFPHMIEWDGTNDAGDRVQDGEYYCELAYSTNDAISHTTESVTLVMDSQIPEAELSASVRIVTPDGDRKNDIVKITQKTRGDANDNWTGEFISPGKKTVKTWNWTGRNVPNSLNWDGKNDGGNAVPDGIYTYRLTGKDAAGNQSAADLELAVVNNSNTADVFAAQQVFSPDGDGISDKTVFNFINQAKGNILSWNLQIYEGKDEKRNVLKEFSGDKSLPLTIDWDGKSDKNSYLKDGTYSYQLIAKQTSDEIKSTIRKIIILTKKPDIDFTINTNHFTPDGDGIRDQLVIYPAIKKTRISEWKLVIHEKFGPGRKLSQPVREWSGTGQLAGKIIWNGIKDKGILIGSHAAMEIEFEYTDELGRKGKEIVRRFRTGLLAVPEKNDRFRISITENEIRNGKSVLKDAKRLVRRYPGFKIELQAHTSQTGNDEKNLLSSEARAKDIFHWLYRKKVPFKRYNFRGCGELEPLVTEEDIYSLNKNSRIDFLIY